MCVANIPSNERSLIIRLIAGDEDAFCELYAAYKNRLTYSCVSLNHANTQKISFRTPSL